MKETIVVGYDGKDPAKRALERALEEAKTEHAELVIVAVEAMPVDPSGPAEFDMLGGERALYDPVVEPPDLMPILDEAMQRADAEGVPAEVVWGAGDVARSIVDAARSHDAAKIMIGSHHHSYFTRLFGLDVASSIQREANCDVVIVP
jgi:nucleotide-binding universal stress UspA family protein